jgi:flagellar biosynthesis chaperone FliJ
MKKPPASGTLHALMRMAKWNLDDVQIKHGEAVSLREQSQQALESAQQQLDDSHDRLRQVLSGRILNADMLQYHHMQNKYCQQQVSECDQQHAERLQQTQLTQQQLLDARTRTETFLRLSERRVAVMDREYQQQQNRKADELGVTRSASDSNEHFMIIERRSV